MSSSENMDDPVTTSASWSHTFSPNRIDVLVYSIGNKVTNVVMLEVDEDGLPA